MHMYDCKEKDQYDPIFTYPLSIHTRIYSSNVALTGKCKIFFFRLRLPENLFFAYKTFRITPGS